MSGTATPWGGRGPWSPYVWLLEGNEKFQKRKCAYFLTKLKGRWVISHFHFFSSTPIRALIGKSISKKLKTHFYNNLHIFCTKISGGRNLKTIFCFHVTPYWPPNLWEKSRWMQFLSIISKEEICLLSYLWQLCEEQLILLYTNGERSHDESNLFVLCYS